MIIDWMLSAAVMIKDFSEIAFRVYEMTSLLLIRVAMMHLINKKNPSQYRINYEYSLLFEILYPIDSIYISQFSNKWS